MSREGIPNGVDFSQFWVKVRRGEITTPAVFDEEAFRRMFGEEATRAFAQFSSSSSLLLTPEEREKMFQGAIETVKRTTGVHPEKIRRARRGATIEDLPD